MIILKKNLGQNFLINNNILKNIIKKIKPKKKQIFVEIGCGTGQLTKKIIKYTNNIIALDIDSNLIKLIKKKIKKKIIILKKNILNFNFKKLFIKKNKKIRIFGNIPYYITRKIILKLINNIKYIKNIFILVQKEFGKCLISKPGKKKYCKISALTKIYFKIKIIKEINKKNFYPKPKINSVLIKLIPNSKYKKINFNILNHILNNCFIKKNRKLKNNIKNIININKLKKFNINKNQRINKLKIKTFYKLTILYKKLKKKY